MKGVVDQKLYNAAVDKAEAVTLMHSYLTACRDSTDAQARQFAAWEAMTKEQRVDATNRRMKMGAFGKRG